MDALASIPWASGSLVGITIAVIFSVFGMVYKGLLVPRSTHEDVRKDRDARVAEANEDADQWRRLWEAECAAHGLTRKALLDEMHASLAASTEGAQLAAALLQEIRKRQIEAGS